MTEDRRHVAASLTEAYKGIEGFYIVNRAGELGYVSTDGQRLVKEEFKEAGADLPDGAIEEFFSTLREAARSFPPSEDKELGYLMPVNTETVWNTATLRLHEYVDKDLRDAFERDMTKGLMTLDEGDRRARDITTERGLHRGVEDLLAHVGSFGTHIFFPVLYHRNADEDCYPLRVLNLLALLPNPGKFDDIVSLMRRTLNDRGALNRSSRVEHRFKLVDED